MGRVLVWEDEKGSAAEWWRWLKNNEDILNVTTLYSEKWLKWYSLQMCVSPQLKKKKLQSSGADLTALAPMG